MTAAYGFELLRQQDIPELNTKARLFRHIKTGAQLLSLENGDENKVFGITFRTPASNSTGVPHIMEHSVLCGSRKYPVKEPFVELVKGSLNTFINAMTFPDKTSYPVASTNLQDFYNLVDVYLDAVFHPLIPRLVFEQEGWHYELDAPEAEMAYKGVVFNEMKGQYSSPDFVLSEESQRSLFPDVTYGYDSGGNPAKMIDLTYEQFKSFHQRYYHPSNARIYFYGDDDPEERLRRIDEYLKDFDQAQVDSAVGIQPSFPAPKQIRAAYDAGEESSSQDGHKVYVSVNWLLPETGNPEETLGLNILGHILIATPASPLRKALIESGLGEDLVDLGLETDLRQISFSTGLKGVSMENTGKVEELILDTLRHLAEKRIDPDTVAASVNTVEFRLRENNTGAFPRGLALMFRSLTTWLHDGDPLKPLAFEAPLTSIKDRLSRGEKVFEELIRRCLVENSHRTTVILEPDPELGKRREAEEKQRLEHARSKMSQADLLEIVEDTRLLKERQEAPDTPEALATIPHLTLADLNRENKCIPLSVTEGAGSQLLYHDLFTNGIVYLDVGLNLHCLSEDQLPYVPLFGRALIEMGTQAEDYVKLLQRIGQNTGGIRSSHFLSTIRQRANSTAWLFLRGKATVPQGEELLRILRDILMTPRLDNRERFKQIVLEEKAGYESALIPGGSRFVNTRLRSRFNEAGWAAEQTSGVGYLFFLRKLVEQLDQDWPSVLERLEGIRRSLLNRNAMIFNITVDEKNWLGFRPRLMAFLESLPAQRVQEDSFGVSPVQSSWNPVFPSSDEGLAIPAQVNYVGKGANLYKLGYSLNGSILVISNYLNTSWLWERVRVRGGAYGVSSVFDHRSGVLTFLSYRDPNLAGTLDIYDQTGQFLRQLELSKDELTKSIIGVISDLDAYQLPDAKGYTSMLRYLAGDTEESRQRLRDQVLSTQVDDFHALAGVIDSLRDQGKVVVMGSKENIASANAEIAGEKTGARELGVVKVL